MISLIFWILTLVVSVKYASLIMRADNNGEGGIMALLALVQRTRLASPRVKLVLVGLGVLGASLFYGDGTITPAISVLSAVEGLNVATPSLGSAVVPIAAGILLALFAIQRFGTGAVGRLFGPVMAVWFTAIAAVGLREVADHPQILKALSPTYALTFFADHPGVAFVALGSVVLTVTGVEALYADLGHFGRGPIRRAWFAFVAPALTLNYLGQGALVLQAPRSIANPFFLLVPGWGRFPMVLLATAATIIASQAVISGAFSLSHQAVQLGLLPRLTIRHTSTRRFGQVYAPLVNWCLAAVTVGLVVGFGSSTGLAGAYGIAVTGTMAITTILFLGLVRTRWRWPLWVTLAVGAIFLSLDLVLFSASLTKLPHGGWLPVVIAAVVFTILTTWRRGHEIVTRNRIREEGPLRRFVEEVRATHPKALRAPGAAVFLNANRDTTPLALRANLEFNHVLHRSVVIVFVRTLKVPHVEHDRRVTVDDLGYSDDGITHLTARFGFRDRQDIAEALAAAARQHPETTVDPAGAFYCLSRITIVRTAAPEMSAWRKRLFIAMARNEADPIQFYGLPDERTVTMGSLIEL